MDPTYTDKLLSDFNRHQPGVQQAYRAMVEGDFDALAETLTPDVQPRPVARACLQNCPPHKTFVHWIFEGR